MIFMLCSFSKIIQKNNRIFFIINALNNWKHSFGWLLTDKQADWKPYECYWWDGKINNKHLLTTFKPLMNINFKIFILKRQHRITEILLITGVVKTYSDSKKFAKGFLFFSYFFFVFYFWTINTGETDGKGELLQKCYCFMNMTSP